jgi:EAL domain-containing protein (putative c-di-GMP-specific phosphodiesterase class I)
VALDDFGTGYSSLTYLRTLPIHTIKIDRSFVSGLGDGATNDAVTRAMLDLAGTLGLHQVAEGVETDEQASRLRGLQCTYGQGYHFSRPVPPDRFSEILIEGGTYPMMPARFAATGRHAAAA